MNEWQRAEKMAQYYKGAFPVGTRILLEQMGDDPRPIPPNTRGTVEAVDDIGTVHCTFDNGRHLGLVPQEDSFRKLTQRELEEEQRKSPLADKILEAEQKRFEQASKMTAKNKETETER